MSAPIIASVGENGTNIKADVIVVQTLLNSAGAKLKADGDCGSKTIQAIQLFQKVFMAMPDGRVDVNGSTWTKLLEGKLKIKNLVITPKPLILLPQVCGLGYYTYSPTKNQYGTKDTINAIQQVCLQFKIKWPGVEVGIGDISFQSGALMPPHKSHRAGIHVDVRPLRTDKKNKPITITDTAYSRAMTKALVECFQSHANYKSVLFNDKEIKGTKFYSGHHNHLHVSFKA